MGAITSAAFAIRNGCKCAKGDKTRGAVAMCQTVGAMDNVSQAASSVFSGVSKTTGDILSRADGAVETIFSKFDKSGNLLDNVVKTTGATTKIGAVAQKAVNPLLCVSAGIRVLKDDDQYAALIEETSAMGTMFAAESAMKYARNAITGGTQATTGMAGKVAKLLGSSKNVSEFFNKISDGYKKLSTSAHGSGKQMLARIGLDALFVAGSIFAYNTGHKVGEGLSHRSEETNQNSK